MDKIDQQPSFIQLAQTVANNFRLGYEGAANDLLVGVISQLVEKEPLFPFGQRPHFIKLCNLIAAAQQRRDTLLIADIIEYEIVPLFE